MSVFSFQIVKTSMSYYALLVSMKDDYSYEWDKDNTKFGMELKCCGISVLKFIYLARNNEEHRIKLYVLLGKLEDKLYAF